jgi:hypothetical protein
MTLSAKGLYMTLSINDTQHDNSLPYADCSYAECHVLFTIMLSVTMLHVVMLSVVVPRGEGLYSQPAFSSLFTNGPNKLDLYITQGWKGLQGRNTLAHWTHS